MLNTYSGRTFNTYSIHSQHILHTYSIQSISNGFFNTYSNKFHAYFIRIPDILSTYSIHITMRCWIWGATKCDFPEEIALATSSSEKLTGFERVWRLWRSYIPIGVRSHTRCTKANGLFSRASLLYYSGPSVDLQTIATWWVVSIHSSIQSQSLHSGCQF